MHKTYENLHTNHETAFSVKLTDKAVFGGSGFCLTAPRKQTNMQQ